MNRILCKKKKKRNGFLCISSAAPPASVYLFTSGCSAWKKFPGVENGRCQTKVTVPGPYSNLSPFAAASTWPDFLTHCQRRHPCSHPRTHVSPLIELCLFIGTYVSFESDLPFRFLLFFFSFLLDHTWHTFDETTICTSCFLFSIIGIFLVIRKRYSLLRSLISFLSQDRPV